MAKAKTTTRTNTRTKAKAKDGIRKKIVELIEQIEQTWVEVSVLLADVYENEKFKDWGYEKFEDYTTTELNLEYRSAMYRVQLGKAIQELGLDKNRLKKIGWTKIKELLPLLKSETNEKTLNDLLKKAEKESYRSIRDFVKQVKEEIVAAENVEKVKKVKVTFQFLQDQFDIVNRAIDRAMELANTDNKALALEYICGEWLEMDDGDVRVDDDGEETDDIEIELE